MPSADDLDIPLKVAKLETHVDRMQSEVSEFKAEMREFRKEIRSELMAIRTHDFRLLFGAIITIAVGLSALMAKGFHWL
jgi:molecular chaperone GrpE (heat shock protein)